MVIAHHILWTAYGTWLPNDPRGSTSEFVASPALADLAPVHPGRKIVQPSGAELNAFRRQAEPLLDFPVLRLDEAAIEAIAKSFAAAKQRHTYTIYACEIMPDHIHLLIRKHRDNAETMIENLQSASRAALLDAGIFLANHPVWTTGGCKGFLRTPPDVQRTINYIQQNPIKIGRNVQNWEFITRYDNWPYHKLRAR